MDGKITMSGCVIIDVDFINKRKNFSIEDNMSNKQRDTYLSQIDKALNIALEFICRLHPDDITAQEMYASELLVIKKQLKQEKKFGRR